MQRFDCLALECPLFGPHLLEASAGTGKTFSIEHIFVRLILESVDVEQILVATFTKAAARELKARIFANCEKAMASIAKGEAAWGYLQPHLGSAEAIRKLTDALAGFDRCQIFTIHGFCYRMLQEFAFEAKVGSLSSDPDERGKAPESLRQAAADFLENGLDRNLVCPEQLTLLFKECKSIDELEEALLRLDDVGDCLSFSEIYDQCKADLHVWNLEEAKLLEDFEGIRKNYKAEVKGNFEIQIKALASAEWFPYLLKEKGTLFEFVDPSNRKVKTQEPPFLHYPGFFDWARIHIAPLVQQKVLPLLQKGWYPIGKKVLAQEDHLDPDEILLRMQKGIADGNFARCIREKYQAAIIDEFQDTDPVQWDIFQTLFLTGTLRAVYLVGDPKQSIYRFRKADVYTYLRARDLLGDEHLYCLDTNFRSSKRLIGALNALFSRNWLRLPQANRILPYHPVQAGSAIDSDFSDEKGAVHFFLAEGEPSALFDELFLPAAVREIRTLRLTKCAILVKDRFQAARALHFLNKQGIAAIAKSQISLGDTVSFQAIRELFEAILDPRERGAAKIVMAGPFGSPEIPLAYYKTLLEEKGLVPFARELQLDSDAMQIFELLFAWERKEGFSFEGLKRYLKTLEEPRRMEENEEAVQIMTQHISKGLEFDVVFALGLASRTREGDEELDAEKLRQLYVAMTRAKRRLYVPIALSSKDPAPGTHSPIELFSRHFDGSLLSALSQIESITVETLKAPLILDPPLPKPPLKELSQRTPHPFTPSFLSSFTTLSKPQQSEVKWRESEALSFTMQTMPRGAETGIVIHKIFEMFFRFPERELEAIIDEQLRCFPLAPWKGAIAQMVRQTMTISLGSFTLNEIESCQVEVEFLFSSPPHFVQGVIDLIFHHGGKVYFLDWKTHWLEDYSQDSLQKAMEVHDYGLQATLYTEAIQRRFQAEFGGAYYFFVRGGAYVAV